MPAMIDQGSLQTIGRTPAAHFDRCRNGAVHELGVRGVNLACPLKDKTGTRLRGA
jgi:hypothetical protein